MKNIKELGLELIEVGENTYLVRGDTRGVVVFDLEHIKEMKWDVIASLKPVEGLPALVIEDEKTKWKRLLEFYRSWGFNTEPLDEEYNKARETYKYTEEDLVKVVSLAYAGLSEPGIIVIDFERWVNGLKKKVSQKQLYIEVEEYCGSPLTTERCPKCVDSCDRAYNRAKITDNKIKAVWK